MSEDGSKGLKRRDFLKHTAAAGAGAVVGAGGGALGTSSAQGGQGGVSTWHREADVVVIGAGASGIPAAIRARDLKASVVVVEENYDIGGHGIISQGSVALGGGTRLQKKYNVEDSADQVYLENTRPEHTHTRYADRKVVRAFADHNVEVFNFLEANGVVFIDARPANVPAEGASTLRRVTTLRSSDDLKDSINGTAGSGSCERSKRAHARKGVEILLDHKMTRIVREQPLSGRVLGVVVTDLKTKNVINIRARQGVIACTGGSSSNLVIRTIYNPLLTEEYQVGCEPYTKQSGDAEQQGMAIGATLGSTNNMRTESYLALVKPQWLGCRYGYDRWKPGGPVFDRAGASGIAVADYQDLIWSTRWDHGSSTRWGRRAVPPERQARSDLRLPRGRRLQRRHGGGRGQAARGRPGLGHLRRGRRDAREMGSRCTRTSTSRTVLLQRGHDRPAGGKAQRQRVPEDPDVAAGARGHRRTVQLLRRRR